MKKRSEQFFMLDLIEFRNQAEYADGRETDLTGKEANDLYSATGVQRLIEGRREGLVLIAGLNAGGGRR